MFQRFLRFWNNKCIILGVWTIQKLTGMTISWENYIFVYFGQFWSFLVISKFSKAHIFVTFGFWSKIFFFWTTKLLLFHQKNFGGQKVKIMDFMKNLGGVQKTPFFAAPQKWNFRFRQDCRKTMRAWISKSALRSSKSNVI